MYKNVRIVFQAWNILLGEKKKKNKRKLPPINYPKSRKVWIPNPISRLSPRLFHRLSLFEIY